MLEKVGHEVGGEGFYTFSVANGEDVDGGGTGDSTQYAVDNKIERKKLPLSSSIPISSLPCPSPRFDEEKEVPVCPAAISRKPQTVDHGLLCNVTRDHTKAQRIKYWRRIERWDCYAR